MMGWDRVNVMGGGWGEWDGVNVMGGGWGEWDGMG